MREFAKAFLFSTVLWFVVGCAAVGRYDNCKNDPVCVQKMNDARQASYIVSKSTAQATGMPSSAEVIALLVSNLVAFGTGVWHGKRKV